jgi:MFS family permease
VLFISNTAFFFAMNGQFVVRSYLAFKLTDSELALGLINLVVAIPMLIISPFGGVVSDRFNRKKLVLVGQSIIVFDELLILTLILTDTLQFWHLMATVAVMGAVFPFIMPARQAMTVDIVGRQGLANAMALTMAAMNGARVIAPALAGFIIYLFGVEGTYVVAIYRQARATPSWATCSRACATLRRSRRCAR